jgi:hypothetical protein
MKKIAILTLFLALGLMFVQPLHADTIAYTITGNFFTPASSESDPLGIGSGTGTATFNFILAPPADSITDKWYPEVNANYLAIGLKLTLSGTNADGTYLNNGNSVGALYNYVPPFTNDSFWFVSYPTISGTPLKVSFDFGLDVSFWADGVTPLPKLFGSSDIKDFGGWIYDGSGPTYYKYSYEFSSGTVSTQAVPLPPAVWLFGSGLVGLIGLRRFRRS